MFPQRDAIENRISHGFRPTVEIPWAKQADVGHRRCSAQKKVELLTSLCTSLRPWKTSRAMEVELARKIIEQDFGKSNLGDPKAGGLPPFPVRKNGSIYWSMWETIIFYTTPEGCVWKNTSQENIVLQQLILNPYNSNAHHSSWYCLNESWRFASFASFVGQSCIQYSLVKCHYSLVQCHYSLVKCHHSLVKCHYSLVKCHYSLLKCHYSLVKCQYSLVKCHYSLVKCHYSLVKCHYSLVKCHYSLVKCHYSLVKCHLLMVRVMPLFTG